MVDWIEYSFARIEPFLLVEGARSTVPELQGEIDDIVKEKCRLAVQETNMPTLVEDTSLGFNAMNGLPGPYIKWFLEKLGHQGLNKMLDGFSDRRAQAICTFAYTEGIDCEIEVQKLLKTDRFRKDSDQYCSLCWGKTTDFSRNSWRLDR